MKEILYGSITALVALVGLATLQHMLHQHVRIGLERGEMRLHCVEKNIPLELCDKLLPEKFAP